MGRKVGMKSVEKNAEGPCTALIRAGIQTATYTTHAVVRDSISCQRFSHPVTAKSPFALLPPSLTLHLNRRYEGF